MDIKTVLKTSAAAAALAVAFTPAAEAGKIGNGQKAVDLKVYGQANRTTIFIDNGRDSDIFHGDNGVSSSRLGFDGSAKVNEDVSLKAKLEYEAFANQTSSVDFASDTGAGDLGLRHARVQFVSKKFGTLTMGHTSEAGDGKANPELWGIGNTLDGASVDTHGGAVSFINESGGAAVATVDDAFSKFDGGRDDVIRYDTPKFAGLSVAVSHSSGNEFQVGGSYGGKFGDIEVAAAIGYEAMASSSYDSRIFGGISALHSSGISASFAYGAEDSNSGNSNIDPEYFYGSLGYQTKLIDAGTTGFGVDYYSGSEISRTADEDSSAFGIGVEQSLAGGAAQVGLGMRYFDLDRDGTDTDEIYTVFVSTRLRF